MALMRLWPCPRPCVSDRRAVNNRNQPVRSGLREQRFDVAVPEGRYAGRGRIGQCHSNSKRPRRLRLMG
jgi:hypothetical protein